MMVMTGANGRLGRQIARELAARGHVTTVTLATRTPDEADDLRDLGFSVVEVDFSEPRLMRRVFDQADTLFMISATGPVAQRSALHASAIDAARAAGVGRIVYTSRVNPSSASLYPFARIHADSEELIRRSGMRFTLLRNNEYAENLDRWIAPAIESGVLTLGGVGKIAFVTRDDVVASCVAVITDSDHDKETYEISGPEALDREEIAAILSDATGVSVRAAQGTRDDFGLAMRRQGYPDFIVDMAKGVFDASQAGEWANTSVDPEQLMGRPAERVSDYIRRRFGVNS